MAQKQKFWLLTISATVSLMLSCTESYPGLDFDQTEGRDSIGNQDSWAESTPIKVFVNEQDIFIIRSGTRSSTRGVGPFDSTDPDNENRLDNATFYVLAFRDGKYTQGSNAELQKPTDLRWWSYAQDGPNGWNDNDKTHNHNHCLLDGLRYNYGLPMYLNAGGSGLLDLYPSKDKGSEGSQSRTEYYYSSDNQQVPYNFFAYYLDNMPVEAHRTETSFYYDAEIDGTQDVMCGAAPDLLSQIRSGKLGTKWDVLSADEKRTLENIGGYCTFAAHRGIHPEVRMKHLLTRFRFIVYPADNSADDITIKKISIESRHKRNAGKLVVAARYTDDIGFTFMDKSPTESTPLYLREPYDSSRGYCPDLESKTVTWNPDKKKAEQKRDTIGSSLMLAPDTGYILYLEGTQMKEDKYGDPSSKKAYDFHSAYTLSIDDLDRSEKNRTPDGSYWFAPGNIYNIQIAVYGLKEIEIKAYIDGWVDGGTIEKDEEDNWFNF